MLHSQEFRIPRFELAVHSGEGFVPDDDDQKSLRNIESRLKEIMPPEDFESVMHTPSTPQVGLYSSLLLLIWQCTYTSYMNTSLHVFFYHFDGLIVQ